MRSQRSGGDFLCRQSRRFGSLFKDPGTKSSDVSRRPCSPVASMVRNLTAEGFMKIGEGGSESVRVIS